MGPYSDIFHLRSSSSHVNNTGSSEINHTDAQVGIVPKCSQEPCRRPNRTDNNGVDLWSLNEAEASNGVRFRLNRRRRRQLSCYLQMQ